MTEEEKSIRVLSFSGKKDDWDFWEEKFLARASRKGFKKILLSKPEEIPADDESLDESKPEEKAKIDARKKNSIAFEELILSIDASTKHGKVAFRLV